MVIAVAFIIASLAVLAFVIGAVYLYRGPATPQTRVELHRLRNQREASVLKAELRDHASYMRRQLDRELDAMDRSR